MSHLQFIRFYSGSPCVSQYLFCVLDCIGFVHSMCTSRFLHPRLIRILLGKEVHGIVELQTIE